MKGLTPTTGRVITTSTLCMVEGERVNAYHRSTGRVITTSTLCMVEGERVNAYHR